jgi:hypothetical protein
MLKHHCRDLSSHTAHSWAQLVDTQWFQRQQTSASIASVCDINSHDQQDSKLLLHGPTICDNKHAHTSRHVMSSRIHVNE